MDSTRFNLIARAKPPPVTLSPIVLDRNCEQVLELITREIQKNIKKIIYDGKNKSERIQKNSPVRPDQSYFGVDEEYVVKNLEDNLPQFFCTNSSDESRRYCESLCEFSRLIARETVSKIKNRMGLMLRDTSEGSCDIPDTLHTMIARIGYITNCLRTSSTTHSQEEDQDLHEHRGDQVSRISHLRKSEERGKSDDDHKSPPLVATTSINHCDEEDQDPQEDMDDELRFISHLRGSEESLNSDDGNSGDESSEDENSEDSNNPTKYCV
ncbi:unnamed protein product [Pleuronectes platessa]|uniref:Uncharacterized protein n=1 Tax=Pleuronectes platessa TaxID=8262 RepID=A0A9N7UQW1_PLEPL|nr:unnamed protein product [Pleuronectes platessa]